MRRSPIHHLLADLGARFVKRGTYETVGSFSDEESEYNSVRNTIGLSDFSHMQVFSGNPDDVIFGLDEALTGNVANIRYGRVLHTLLLNEEGRIRSDVYVACSDEELLVLTESCCAEQEISGLLCGAAPALQEITEGSALFSLDGPHAWEVVKKLFGRDVLGMLYLSIEEHVLDGATVHLIRAGKTSEFGYLLVVPSSDAETIWRALQLAGEEYGLGLCGLDVQDLLRLDGRFHNVQREGSRVGDPLALGLQWMFDFDKEKFIGRDAVLRRRERGLERKILGICATTGRAGVNPGDRISLDQADVGEIVTAEHSYTLERRIGLALVDKEVSFPGVDFKVVGEEGETTVRSISMPPFVPRSLLVKLDEV